jgi:hypothetical protein
MPWHSDISCTGVLLNHDMTGHTRVKRRDQQIHPAPEIVAGGQADEATDKGALGVEVPFVRRHGPEVLDDALFQRDPVGQTAACGVGDAGTRSCCMGWNCAGVF